jgi:hypothetical protein
MLLAELRLFLRRKLAQVIAAAVVSLLVFQGTPDPHVDCSGGSEGLEGDTGGETGNVLWPIFDGEDKSGHDTAELASTDSKSRGSASLDVSDDLVDTRVANVRWEFDGRKE